MDFATMGKVGLYIKQKNLSFAANYKIKTGQRAVDSEGNLAFKYSSMYEQVSEANKTASERIKAARLENIKHKLMRGKKLSAEEMVYLRENDDELYKKAKHAEDAREELKADLKNAESKQEARQILTRAMVKASAEAGIELSTCKSGVSTGGAVSDVSISMENISTENVSVNENPTSTENISNPLENNPLDENHDEKNSTQSVMEKFMMTIRALEDEWMHYSNSDEYKNLPENYFQDEEVYTVAEMPNRKLLSMIYNYRQSANIA